MGSSFLRLRIKHNFNESTKKWHRLVERVREIMFPKNYIQMFSWNFLRFFSEKFGKIMIRIGLWSLILND